MRDKRGLCHAGDDAILDRPAHSWLGPGADRIGVGVSAKAVIAGGLAGVAPEHGSELLAGDIAVGVLAVAHTVRHCPGASGFEPVRAGDGLAVDAGEDI